MSRDKRPFWMEVENCHKRKEPDDYLISLLSGIDLSSPTKKIRPNWNSVNALGGENPSSGNLASSEIIAELVPALARNSSEIILPANDEKAIVLYKPINEPLFPGGPTVGSLELPIWLNSNIFPKGSKLQELLKSFPIISGSGYFQEQSTSQQHSTSDSDIDFEGKKEDKDLALVAWQPMNSSANVRLGTVAKDPTDQSMEEDDSMLMEEEDEMDMVDENIHPQMCQTDMGAHNLPQPLVFAQPHGWHGGILT